jgi:hypothetical protein
VGLTPLIPLPFVDDMVQTRLLRRMVRQLADGHALRVWDEEVRLLAETPSKNLVASIAKKVVLSPFKKVLRTAFFLLSGKKMVDLASQTYHTGWLIDHAFAEGWVAPHGSHRARDVRSAIDRVMEQVPLASSPVTRALKVGFESSRDALADVFEMVQAQLGVIRREPRDDEVARIADDVEQAGLIERVVEQLRRALLEVPDEHFEDLAERFAAELGVEMKAEEEGDGSLREVSS